MIKKSLLFLSLFSLAGAQSFDEFQQQQEQMQNNDKQDFSRFAKSQEEAFDTYEKEQLKALDSYKKSLQTYWNEPKLSTKKEWLSYSDDKKSRADVNFEKNRIKLETLASSQEEAKKQLKLSLAKVVTVDNKTVQQNDPLEKMLSQVKKPDGIITKQVKNEPILSNVIFDKKPTKATVSEYVNTNIDDTKIKEENSKINGLKLYTVEIALPADTMQKKAQQYEDVVKEFASKEGLNPALVFAVIQTESSFNPRATSYVPAYGLMQIVPSTAGVDAYNYLHSEKKLVTGEYLYDSTNNIEMGNAYLHILYYNYFKDVKDPLSRLFCSIAAYNTGSGNVAWVFNKEKNISEKQKLLATPAAADINALSSDAVYNKLINELKYDEARQYLKNVSNRALAFSKLYSKN